MCRRQGGSEGYVPAIYVKEIEPIMLKKIVKKRVPIMVKTPEKRSEK